MSKFLFTRLPPSHWHELCVSEGNLFHSLEWQTVLKKAFNSQTLYGWNAETETGVAITIFKVGPFRIGYVGFPVGGILGKQPLDNESLMALSKAPLPIALHFLRLPTSAFDDNGMVVNLDSITTPETAIVDLQKWQLSQLPKLNRDIKKANRSGLKVIDALSSHGKICYHLYKDTIRRHDGNLRYNLNYFNALIELSHTQTNLRCLLAFLDDEIAGFIIIALHGKTAYYLHGAMNQSLRRYCASDRLLHEAIVWARKKGMNCFNLMASPSNQVSLIRYKEKWGGITKEQKVYELPIKPLYAKVFKGTMWFYNHLNKYFT
ncbi:GNAT family N-acetyltransferase [Candidatus Parabeggiatoa sp. HSG14]|uniref:GNAT family N-acetyltransferase n=1 Tax=Candidatus Parabeggiatoa sp. HSG14 TaxID=3055593 RepID=UPI0025A761E8|nr:GNAT family N-acetyltransferase [Thiotrichales bacterium HSG14]